MLPLVLPSFAEDLVVGTDLLPQGLVVELVVRGLRVGHLLQLRHVLVVLFRLVLPVIIDELNIFLLLVLIVKERLLLDIYLVLHPREKRY